MGERDAGVQQPPHGERGDHEQQRGQRVRDPFGGRTGREQLFEHSGGGEQPECEGGAGCQLQHQDQDRRPRRGVPDDANDGPEAGGQPTQQPGQAERAGAFVEPPVRVVHLQLGLDAHAGGPGSGNSTEGNPDSGCSRSSW
jgi:hypothetical protein